MNFEALNITTSTEDEVISVSQLNKMAKNTLENHLPIMWIKGEISGLKTYSHLYFDLKDESAKISCVMFAKLAAMVDFQLENGTQVEVRGRVTIYPANGSYQINVERIRKVGLGALWEAYARLINKLRDEGLFDSKYKKPIPVFPRSIGVITSKEGAVIRDVVTTLRRRMPNIPIVIYHSAVQGNDASMQLVRALRAANQRQEVDVLIVCRGGGSMEDLWSFNEEIVAREVFGSQIPVISAVGHETDTTIIDFVADMRAPTPTAAAELVARSREEWLNSITGIHFRLNNIFSNIINYKQQQLDLSYAQLKSKNPVMKIKLQLQTLAELRLKLSRAILTYIRDSELKLTQVHNELNYLKPDVISHTQKIDFLASRLKQIFNANFKNTRLNLISLNQRLTALNPANILERGYAIVKDSSGHVIKNSDQVKHHARLSVTLGKGEISAIADKKHDSRQEELI